MHLPAGLYVPMMVALDFKGFKLLAVSLLPIGKHTLVYGMNSYILRSRQYYLITHRFAGLWSNCLR